MECGVDAACSFTHHVLNAIDHPSNQHGLLHSASALAMFMDDIRFAPRHERDSFPRLVFVLAPKLSRSPSVAVQSVDSHTSCAKVISHRHEGSFSQVDVLQPE